MNEALIIIDMQNDFMDDGPLAVPGALALVPLINQLMPFFRTIMASKDWHPAGHHSFAARYPHKKPGDIVELQGIKHMLWSVHCVEGSYGAEIVHGLNEARFNHIVLKGNDPSIDSYSAFFDNDHQRSTGLDQELKYCGIQELYLCGVALDYCVKWTALDACALGYSVFVIADACRGIELKTGDMAQAMDEMQARGVAFISSVDLGKKLKAS